MPASTARKFRPETHLVHAGTLRSQFGETSEALFLTQGYVYESALSAEKRFKNEEPGYQYSRFSNPTVNMFEQRMCALEAPLCACGILVDVALGEVECLGVLAELRAQDARMHEAGLGAIFAIGRRGHAGLLQPTKNRPEIILGRAHASPAF